MNYVKYYLYPVSSLRSLSLAAWKSTDIPSLVKVEPVKLRTKKNLFYFGQLNLFSCQSLIVAKLLDTAHERDSFIVLERCMNR